jgi:ATP-dependent helicase HrpB
MLSGVGLVIFDEFHERNLHSDLALALCRDAQLGLREDLRLLVMSATLDAEPVARLLGNAPLLTAAGRSLSGRSSPISPREPQRSAGRSDGGGDGTSGFGTRRMVISWSFSRGRRRSAPARRVADGREPGAAEPLALPPVRRSALCRAGAERSCRDPATQGGAGHQHRRDQSDHRRGQRWWSTAGSCAACVSMPATGLPRLVSVRVTEANADQRAGRAGRLGPGRCYRLWTEGGAGQFASL